MLGAPSWYARKYNSVVARTRESDPDAEFHVRQIGAQRHTSRLATIDYGDAFVLDLRDKGGIAMSGAINDNALTAVFLWGEGTNFNGERSEIPRLRILGPRTEFNLEMPGSYRLMRVGLRDSALDSLRAASASNPNRRSWLLPGVHEQRFAPGAELELQQKLLRTVRFAELAARRSCDLGPSLAVAASEAGAALARMLSGTEVPSARSFGSRDRRNIVDATLAILETKPRSPVSVSAICDVLGVGERTLERAFQEHLGLNLRAYERERRLRAAHGLILTEGNRLSITDIAMSFSFWHLGRFAGAYAALFGCSPSETRRRIWGDADDPIFN
ncbi:MULTISPECIES: helix-turn-helix domain-containing protein [unclassified Beijerinckia]|uniref:AraC family transcriptional regulator n=1 Tax=unclassified Beijerinckia TaxID=2638183 RepID=UPI000899A7D7|nr:MULTISPECIES: helix-turn-helix domain-containing protein [unclassified Beijerinckia]MDH7798880.1 AraC-like DNA-binding protein [Beijerinckia sp. GAS462]SED88159.1 Helix-turn-helix domain-containing protein [Beijerinckia sp. 28-YEA-48]